VSSPNQNIVIVTSEFPPQPGGIGNHSYNLALYLSKENYAVTVITDQRSKTGKEEHIFDQTLPFVVSRIKRQDLRFRMYFQRLIITRKLFRNASHIIATGKFSLWNVAFLSAFQKIPTTAVIHGTEVNFKSFLLRKSIDTALKKFDNIVAVSNYTKDLVSHLNLNITVIPNGIDVSAWELKETQDLKLKGEPCLTTVGRVSSRKGQLNVIKQLPELIKQFPEIHYHCVGIPTEADAFIKEAKQLKVHEYITFHGSVDELKLRQILSKTDVFVMLSSEDKLGDVEGFGIAILEANAMGVPAVGAKGCGIEDAINQHSSGVLINVNQASQFIDAITRIIQEKSKYKSGAVTWAKAHDWSYIIQRYEALF
jgi:phosphatidylinositol alpha-1,6-mannosyltransferase